MTSVLKQPASAHPSVTDQDAMDEAFRQHKNYFQHFLEPKDDGLYGQYGEKLRVMLSTGATRLCVDVSDLRAYDAQFASEDGKSSSGAISSSDNIVARLMRHPTHFLPAFEEAINEHVMNLDSSYGQSPQYPLKTSRTTDGLQGKQLDSTSLSSGGVTHAAPFTLGLVGSLGPNDVSPRTLVASYLGQLVKVVGIVTKLSPVRPKVVTSVHYCPHNGKTTSREYRDGSSLRGLPTPTVYPTKTEDGHLLETEFGLCVYKDYQLMTIQEAPETAPLGQLPRSVDVICEYDLVDKCKPGDRVQVMGMYRAMVGKMAAQVSTHFRTVVIANNVATLGKEIQGIVMTTGDLFNVREIGKRADIFALLGRSIAPSIYGHAKIKQALLLQLLGGCEKNLENGTHLRGDINILMVGDPSTAKSQLLRFIHNIAPLAVNTTGRGSSGVGLTAAVTRDVETKEKRLEAGAMVLADRGIVCIDEFDKMSEADRVAIHEVMEQQTVTIAKAGIHATLNARCSVLAAANPVYGQYDKTKLPVENIGLPDSLLSRFDLLFVVLDKLDRGLDRHISQHVLRIHRYQKPGQEGLPVALDALMTSRSDEQTPEDNNDSDDDEDAEDNATTRHMKNATPVWQKYNPVLHGDGASYVKVLSMEFLKKYIYYAKTRFNPLLTDAAIETISQGYAELRSEQSDKTLPVTARSLETLIRLSAAHAKCRLHSQIEEQDAQEALAMMKCALYNAASEQENPMQVKDPLDEDSLNTADEDMAHDPTLSSPEVAHRKRAREVAGEVVPESSSQTQDDISNQAILNAISSVTTQASSSSCEVIHLLKYLNTPAALRARRTPQILSKTRLEQLLQDMDTSGMFIIYDRVNNKVTRCDQD